jgi:2-desacetyl-2-hydroxyethyl bacteriochlorophyllide A dehydrogenase
LAKDYNLCGHFINTYNKFNKVLRQENMRAKYAVIPEKEHCEIRFEDLDPANLSADELLVKADFSMVSAGTELAGFCALSPGVYQKGAWNAYPWRPGYGLTGSIIAAGLNQKEFNPGGPVFCFGRHAELQIFPVDLEGKNPSLSAFVPDNRLDNKTITAARMGLVSLTAPQVSGLETGSTVAVFGLGMVGNLTAQIYQHLGARVIAFDPIAMRCETARRTGILEVINVPPQKQLDALMDLTSAKGANICVDAVGSSAVIQTCIKGTANYGKIVLLGTPRAKTEDNLTDVFRPVHLKCLQVLGAFEWRQPPHPVAGVTTSIEANLHFLWNLIQKSELRVNELISHVIKPEELESAYFGLLKDKENYLGVIVDWRC